MGKNRNGQIGFHCDVKNYQRVNNDKQYSIHLYQCSFKDTSEQVLPWAFKTIEFIGLSEVKNKKETSQGLAMNQDIVYICIILYI